MGNAGSQIASNPATGPALQQVGGYLQQWRSAQPGLTADQAARRAGVSRGTWWRMERGEGGVRMESYLAAFAIMGVLQKVIQAAEPSLFHAEADRFFPGYG